MTDSPTDRAEPAAVAAVAQADAEAEGARWVTSRVGPRGFRTAVEARDHALVTD